MYGEIFVIDLASHCPSDPSFSWILLPQSKLKSSDCKVRSRRFENIIMMAEYGSSSTLELEDCAWKGQWYWFWQLLPCRIHIYHDNSVRTQILVEFVFGTKETFQSTVFFKILLQQRYRRLYLSLIPLLHLIPLNYNLISMYF